MPEPNLVLTEAGENYALGFRIPGTYTLQLRNPHVNNGVVYTKKIIVSRLPDPLVKFNSNIHDAGNKNDLIASKKIIPYLGSDELPFFPGIIKSFRVTKISPDQKNESYYNTSDIFESIVSNIINKSKKGDMIMFDNVLITMSDGTTRSANPLAYKIIDQ